MNHKPYNKLINKILLMLNNVETDKQTLFNISYLIWLLKLDFKIPPIKQQIKIPTKQQIKMPIKIQIKIMLFICIQRINLNLNYPF